MTETKGKVTIFVTVLHLNVALIPSTLSTNVMQGVN